MLKLSESILTCDVETSHDTTLLDKTNTLTQNDPGMQSGQSIPVLLKIPESPSFLVEHSRDRRF